MTGFSYDYLSNDAMCVVFINHNRAGSAYMFLYNGNIYALTAYHCIFDDNNDQLHDDYAFGYDLDNTFEVEVIYPQSIDDDQRKQAKSNDIALVLIRSGECINRKINSLHSRIKVSSNNNYSIIGYPCNISQKHIIELDVNFKHQENPHINEFALLKKEDISVIKGFSGGIVCEKIDDIYYFCGLVSRALSENFEYDYIKCSSLESINKVLNIIDCNLPEIPECCYKRILPSSYIQLKDVLSRKEFLNNWVDVETSTQIEATIKEFLDNESYDSRICTFVGLSGIGKTRSVLNACKKLCEEATIYYENIERFNMDYGHKWIDDKNLVIIIDELKDCDWLDIYNKCAMNKCKIILIATIPQKAININNKSSVGFHTINNTSTNDMIKILKAQYNTFQDIDIEQICNLSYRDLRLALLISDLYSKDMRMNFTTFSSTSLVANYGTAEKILDKTLSALGREKESLSKIYQQLSTFKDVGYAESAKIECEFLAKYFDNSFDNYVNGIKTLSDNNLGTKNKYYFKAMPLALSKLAFENYIWPLVRNNINDFISQLPNISTLRGFYERITECELENEEVIGAFAPYFQDCFERQAIPEIFINRPDEIALYIEFNPELGLMWLEDRLTQMQDICELKYNRQYVVHLCEKLACFKEHFVICERILFLLAQNETEHVYSNNSQGVWADLFGIIGVNSDLPFNTRIEILFNRLKEENNSASAHSKLFNQAISRVFAKTIFRSVPPKVIGNKLTPSSWNPSTMFEWINCERNTLDRLLDISDSFSKELKALLLETVLYYVHDFISEGLFQNAFNLIDVLIDSNENRIQVIDKIQWLLEIDDLKKDPINQLLESKLLDYQDKTILGRLYEYLHKDIWSYHKGPDHYKILAVELAKDLYSSGESVEKYMPYFTDRDCKNSALEALSNALSRCDINNQLIDFALNGGDEYLSFIKGYISALAENTNNTNEIQRILDKCSEISIDFAFNNTVIFDISKKGYERIGKIGEKTQNIQPNLGYYIVRWFNLMGDDVGTGLLKLTADIAHSMKYCLIFSCGQHLSRTYKSMNKQIDNEVYSFFIDQAKQCCLDKGRYQAFDMIHTFEYIPNELECNLFTSIINFFDFNEFYNSINHEITQLLKRRINNDNNVFLMQLFGQKLLETIDHFKNRAFTGFFDLFPLETVLNWIEENPVERAPLLSYQLSYPTLDSPKCSELTLRLLEKYTFLPDTLKEFIRGTYNLIAVNISEIHDNKEKYLLLYQTYVNYKNPISDWAKWRIDYINLTCNDMDEKEIINQRLNDT